MMLTVIKPEQFHGLMMILGDDLALYENTCYTNFWQYRHDVNLQLDQVYDVHIFEYFHEFLVLFGNRKQELIFRLKYSEYL